MTTWIEVIPAYGRDYTTAKAAKADWNADLDFKETFTETYINKSQAMKMGLSVTIRYAKNMKVTGTK
jgi:hypothetical protein